MTNVLRNVARAAVVIFSLVLLSNSRAEAGDVVLDCGVNVGDIVGFKIVREGPVYKLMQYRASGAPIPERNLTEKEIREKKIKMWVDYRYSPPTARATLVREDGSSSWGGTSWFLDLGGAGGGYAHCSRIRI